MAQTPEDLDPFSLCDMWGACSVATCLGLRACSVPSLTWLKPQGWQCFPE